MSSIDMLNDTVDVACNATSATAASSARDPAGLRDLVE